MTVPLWVCDRCGHKTPVPADEATQTPRPCVICDGTRHVEQADPRPPGTRRKGALAMAMLVGIVAAVGGLPSVAEERERPRPPLPPPPPRPAPPQPPPRGPSVLGTERPPAARANAYHDHLDLCAQCREHPFGLCAIGAAALEREALGPRVATAAPGAQRADCPDACGEQCPRHGARNAKLARRAARARTAGLLPARTYSVEIQIPGMLGQAKVTERGE